MARYRGAACKLCRRENAKLFLKGSRCMTEKCAFDRRAYSPGQHGQSRSKLSNYGLQLREKQKVKRIYGLLEKQFRLYFKRANRAKGVTGHILLQMLECRLDNVVFRMGLALSRKQARQIVRHGAVCVNERKVNIPSYMVRPGDSIQTKVKEKTQKLIKDTLELTKDRGTPTWLEVDAANLKAKVTRLPKRDDVQFPINEQLIVELYSK